MPDYITTGITHMIYKKGDPTLLSNYRPITCLNTFYKILTSLLTKSLWKHINQNNIIPWEQKGCSKGTYGSKEQLIIDSILTEHARHKQRNLAVAFIDYKKAYDSVPHSWLIEVCKIYKVDNTLIEALKTYMQFGL